MGSTLVLLRHGQSTWNLENRFTGWKDIGLTELGRKEASAAGALMRDAGLEFHRSHTSYLKRAILTHQLALEEMDRLWLPVERDWRLNERHYGALQGLNKKETSELHGADQVFQWRRSYDVPPPALELDDERHPRHDARYEALTAEDLPSSECLKDVVVRFMPWWEEVLRPQLASGLNVLVTAHGNSLRALVKFLDKISDEDISQLNIPTGIPQVYKFDKGLNPQNMGYLGDADAARKAAEAVAKQAGA